MRFKISILAAVVLACVGLGLWQRKNIAIVWREYSSLYKQTLYESEDSTWDYRGPYIPAKIAKQDPEAAAIAELRINGFSIAGGTEPIAEKLLQHPDNRYLLFEILQCLGWDDCVIDRQIAIRLADRLIALEPNNPHCHYARSYLLFADRHDNDINAALAELEYANKCKRDVPQWDVFDNLPYDIYKQRVIDIAEKAKLGRFLFPHLQDSSPIAFSFRRSLAPYAIAAFADGGTAEGMRIIDALTEKGEKGELLFGRFLNLPLLELQMAELTKEQAKKDRLALCARWASKEKAEEEWSKYQQEHREESTKEDENRGGAIAAYPAEHFGKMFVALSWGCATLLLICAVRGFGEKNKIRFTEVLLFLVGGIFYFCIVKWFFLQQLLDWISDEFCFCCHFSYIDALRPDSLLPALKHHIKAEPAAAVFLLSIPAWPIVAAVVLWGLGYLKPKKGAFWRLWYVKVLAALGIGGIAMFILMCTVDSIELVWWQGFLVVSLLFSILALVIVTFAWWLFRSRIVRLFLAAIFFGALTFLLRGCPDVSYLPMVGFVLACAIIAVIKPAEGSALKTALRFFSSKSDVAAVRNKCLRLMAPFIAVYWVLFVALVPLVARGIISECGQELKRPVRRRIPVEPNEAYKELMMSFDKENISKGYFFWVYPFGLSKLAMVMPEDLPALLQKLKKKEFTDYYRELPPKDASEEELARWERMKERTRWLNDEDLVRVIEGCGRDVVDIIRGFLDNPEAERSLVARARLGDRTAKEKLEEFLQLRMQGKLEKKKDGQEEHYESYLDMPAKVSDIIGALACICEPNEAAGRFLDYIQNREVCFLMEKDAFFRNISLLPRVQARRVIKAYLDKAKNWQSHGRPTPYCHYRHSWRSMLRPLRELVGFYGDRQVAEEIFEIMLSAADEGNDFEPLDISPYFGEQSGGLLKKGLDHSNPDMRAWCVWQLRRIGYKFSRPELKKLLKDDSWKVRANAVLAGGKYTRALFKSDSSAFVRLVANLK